MTARNWFTVIGGRESGWAGVSPSASITNSPRVQSWLDTSLLHSDNRSIFYELRYCCASLRDVFVIYESQDRSQLLLSLWPSSVLWQSKRRFRRLTFIFFRAILIFAIHRTINVNKSKRLSFFLLLAFHKTPGSAQRILKKSCTWFGEPFIYSPSRFPDFAAVPGLLDMEIKI